MHTPHLRSHACACAEPGFDPPTTQVNIGLRVLTRPNIEKLPEIYQTLGTDYAERVLPSIIQETLKSVIAQYNASQLLTMREVVSANIRDLLTERARYFNIVLADVSITNLTFSREYTAAVEAKQVAQQDAEKAKFIVSRRCSFFCGGWERMAPGRGDPGGGRSRAGRKRTAVRVRKWPAQWGDSLTPSRPRTLTQLTGGKGAAGQAVRHHPCRG